MNRPARALVFAGVAVAYLAAGKLGLALASVHPSATAVWAPTGIALAAFLGLGHRVWPAVFCAAFLVNVTTAGSIATSLGIAAGNTLEAAVGAYLITRFAPASPSFSRPADVFTFTALAALVSPAVSALFGVTSLALGGYARWADYGAIWATWWLGDAAGALIVAPPLLLWSAGQPLRLRWRRLGEALLMLLVVVAVGLAVFSNWLPAPVQRLEFLGIPALVWVAFRFGQREAATATLVMSALAIWGTVQGVGPFAGAATSNAALLSLQAYMSVITLTALVVAAAVDDRRRAELARLDEARDRIRAHEALKESEELHRAIAGLASDFAVIVRVGPEGAVALESATEGFRRVTGYESDELAGRDDWRLLLDDGSATEAQSAGRRVLAGERISLEVRIITKSGVERWLRCHAEPFGGAAPADGVRILGAAEDVTERRRTDETIRRHREAIRELSTPVLRIRDRLLILPVIGEIDGPRAQHLTAELLRSIRTNRAKVVVIDMTGVAAMSPQVAQQIFRTIEACRLLGASIIMTGLSHGIADVLVSFGIDLGRVTSLGDLQSGMEEAERLLAADARGWAPSPFKVTDGPALG
ncbi:MAG TPA: MASE1 domain-containing protein [Methylomirabilota bacterium]|nr:MASE1 domain-containing protein [Methylomirabilota bacterium]